MNIKPSSHYKHEEDMHKHNQHHHDQPGEDAEIKTCKIKLLWSWIFTIPIALLMLSERLLGMSIIPESFMIIVLLVLAFPVVFIFGFSTIKS